MGRLILCIALSVPGAARPLLGELRRRGLRQDRRETRRPNRSPPGGTSNRRGVREADRRSLSLAGACRPRPAKSKAYETDSDGTCPPIPIV